MTVSKEFKDFLFTYGWAIAILISIVVLIYFGIYDTDIFIKNKYINQNCCDRLCQSLPGNFSCISYNNERIKQIECKEISGRADTEYYTISHLFDIKNTTALCKSYK